MILSENRNALFRIMLWYRTAAFDFIPLAKQELFVAPAWQARARMASAGFAA